MIMFGYENIPDELHGSTIAIGNFDGVHIGHQEIVKTAVSIARSKGGKAGVITFDPHPNSLLDKIANNHLLMSVSERANKLLTVGADFVIVIKFTKEFALLKPIEFLKTVLINALNAKHIVTGYNFKFGAKGIGDNRLLAQYANDLNYEFTQINQVKYLGLEISTSYIKLLIANGGIVKASYLLDAQFKISGRVDKGKQMASSVFVTPTANIALDNRYIIPMHGVYFTKIILNNREEYYGIANIGLRPTMENTHIPKLEVHIFDFGEDIYGEYIEVELISFIRPERQFESIEALKYAINSDITFGRYLLNNRHRIGLINWF